MKNIDYYQLSKCYGFIDLYDTKFKGIQGEKNVL